MKANLQDFYNYPTILVKLAQDVSKAALQSQIAKHIIQSKVLQNNNRKDETNQQKTIRNNDAVSKIHQLISALTNEQLTDIVGLLDDANNFVDMQQNNIKTIFPMLKSLDVSNSMYITCRSFYIYDEVCFRDQVDNPTTTHYSQFFIQLQNFLEQSNNQPMGDNPVDCLQTIKNSLMDKIFVQQLFQDQEQCEITEYSKFVGNLLSVEQIISLIFPLSLFIKSSLQNQQNLSQAINSFIFKRNDINTAIQFFKEILSVQAYEAIMYRDLNIVIQSREYKTQFSKQCITNFLSQSFYLPSQSMLVDQFTANQKIYQTDFINSVFLMTGTYCNLTNFVRYTPYLHTSSSSRAGVQRSIHSCPTPAPQFHCSLLINDYYKFGLDCYKYKKASLLFQDVRVSSSYQRLIIDIFSILSINSVNFSQSVHSQVSPQLIIANPLTKEIFSSKSTHTYLKISKDNYILNKTQASYMNNQISIQKGYIGEIQGKNLLQEQMIEVYNGIQLSTPQAVNPLLLSIEDCHHAICMSPLSQSNIPQLADVANLYISFFEKILTTIQIDKVYEHITKNLAFIGKGSEIIESMWLLYYLMLLKYGSIQHQLLNQMSKVIQKVIPIALLESSPIQISTSQYKYQIDQQFLNSNHIILNSQTGGRQDRLNSEKIYLSYLPPELITINTKYIDKDCNSEGNTEKQKKPFLKSKLK
ncbi:Hypothetical_protein [Hexamita inflata]|uniref:Hypothetical_protein n=1 Tax=Hexamita inflata TaxID=28002 RepID=A0AA86UIT0_9EUKA|nr:Hypothetical protein HINF_LOCUS40442 [Hexamita inflata]